MKRLLSHRSLGLLITITFLFAPFGSTSAQTDEFPRENAWVQASPSIVWCDDPNSTTTLTVHIVGRNDVVRVWITDMASSGDEGRVELFDDGTHGDVQAGDNVFTLADLVPPCNPDWLDSRGGINRKGGMLRVELADGTQTGNNYGISMGLVHQKYKDVFAVQDFGNGLSATAYAFFINDANHEVLDNYPVANLYCGTSNFAAYQKLYSVLPDAFDFALVMPGMQILRPDGFGENVPYDVLVSNSVEHIGLPIKDNTAQFGSAGRLKSVIYHSFGSIAIVDHEMAHSWGAGIGQSLGLLNETYEVDLGHWDDLSDTHGQLGAYYFSPEGTIGRFSYNNDETWTMIPNSAVEPYSPLELYIMGLIPAEEVPPIHILQTPDTADPEHVTAASYRTITIDEILRAEGGTRSPDYTQSQKDFTIAFIVTQDTPFNDAAYAFFSLLSHKLESKEPPMENTNFAPLYWATGGRATLTSRLPVDLPDPGSLPGEPIATVEVIPTEVIPTAAIVTSEPVPTETNSDSPPLCGGTLLLGGLVGLQGLWLLLRKRS